MPCVIKLMPLHFQTAERNFQARFAKGGKHASEYTPEELKAGAMERMARVDSLQPEIRALVWEWGFTCVINTGRLLFGRKSYPPNWQAKEAKAILKHLQHDRNMRRVEDDRILGIHKGLDTGTVIDMF